MQEYPGTPGAPGRYAWTRDLSTDGVRRPNPAWKDTESALRELTRDQDSFLILE